VGEAAATAYVGVIGGGATDSPDLEAAEAVGAGLARAGAILVCGGLGGVMEAACRGARQAGGRTIGLLPGRDRGAANPWVEIAIATGLGELRNGLVVRSADGLIAVGGEWGTLSEIALALKVGKPVIGLGTWDLDREGGAREGILVACDAADAVARVLRHASG